MSIKSNTAETEQDDFEKSEEVTSEQSKTELEKGEIASDDDNSEIGETDDDLDLVEALSGKAEPEEGKKLPRSTARALRKNKRLEKQLEAQNAYIAQLEQQQFKAPPPKIPERDYDRETDEQYQFRNSLAASDYHREVEAQRQQFNQRKEAQKKHVEAQTKAVKDYADEVDKLNIKGYDEIEDNVLSAFDDPELVIGTMAQLDPSATVKINVYLNHNPDKLAEFANAARTNQAKFFAMYGEMKARVLDLEAAARNKKRQVSRASGDKALDGVASGNSLDAKLQAAADAGNVKLYRELKAQKFNRG